MYNSAGNLPLPENEPVLSYAPGTAERQALIEEIRLLEGREMEIPLIIGGKEVRTGRFGTCIQPHDHRKVLARFHKAGPQEVAAAISAADAARRQWADLPWRTRASIFIKAAELLAGPRRFTLNAATMLNQGKNVFQAEIDSACELADFWRFNPYYMQQLYEQQPTHSPRGTLNYCEYRPLEGFVLAVTPFNFTSIAGNLPTAPAMMGNTVVWKPASTAVYSGYLIMRVLAEAGMPEGVINFVPGDGAIVANPALDSERLAGVHFTGSTSVFCGMWRRMGENIARYKSYPRIVGETGGKDFVMAHASADLDALTAAVVRGAFEYQGQKCSAVSRMYVPEALWPALQARLAAALESITMGPVQEFQHFMNAVIDQAAFERAQGYIRRAKASPHASVIFGGGCNAQTGYFVEPTVILAEDPFYESMVEEIFAPVLSVFVYDDDRYTETLELCDRTSRYGLTGCIFAADRYAIEHALCVLRNAAGNFYINDKPTGAVVGQQPFGGARASGTNDKAGSMLNLQRWTSVRAVKENFAPPRDYRYAFMEPHPPRQIREISQSAGRAVNPHVRVQDLRPTTPGSGPAPQSGPH